MHSRYRHLGLTRWPFPIVPEPDFCVFIADRKQLRADVEGLLQHLSRRDTSSIHLFWAWYGAGKTHTLFYLANQALALSGQPGVNIMHSAYSEFPKAPRGFVDLYRTFVNSLDFNALADCYLEVCTAPNAEEVTKKLGHESIDLASALKTLATGGAADQATAIRWLRAENVPVAQCRSIGASQRISTAEDASRVLAGIQRVRAAASRCRGYPGYRLIWILDEYQRIEDCPKRIRDEINTSVHSIFNSCPTGLSLLLSFSGKPEPGRMPKWLTPELASRIGRTKVMVLPPLQPKQALIFVRDVLAQFRIPGEPLPHDYFPFSADACQAIIKEGSENGQLKPRDIMGAFNAVLEQAEQKLEADQMSEISAAFATKVLAEYVSVTDEQEP